MLGRISIVCCVGLLPFASSTDVTATAPIVVDTIAGADGDDGACSLTEAIRAANTDLTVDTCRAGDGPDTIEFSVPGTTIELTTFLPAIADDLTIVGDGTTIDAAGHRMFHINGPASVELRDLTLTGGANSLGGGAIRNRGTMTLDRVTVRGNTSTAFGGGIANHKSLTVHNSVIRDNTSSGSSGGGGIYSRGPIEIRNSVIAHNAATAGPGGGLHLSGATEDVHSLSSVTVSGNVAAGFGGGLIAPAYVPISDSVFHGNRSETDGGAIWSTRTAIERTTISANWAGGDGGGVYAAGTAFWTIRESTMNDNHATGDGGGLHARPWGGLRNSTISGNAAEGSGGGAWVDGPTFGWSTITNNNASVGAGIAVASRDSLGDKRAVSFDLYASIVAGNTGGDDIETPGDRVTEVARILEVQSQSNVFGTIAPNLSVYLRDHTSTRVADAGLLPLADNGGATATHALRADARPVDFVVDTTPFLAITDQRGVPRPWGQHRDAGAVECGPVLCPPLIPPTPIEPIPPANRIDADVPGPFEPARRLPHE